MATPTYYYDVSKTGKDYVGKRDISLLLNEVALLESVKNILITEPGERVMHPRFGCALSEFVFEQLDPIIVVSIRTNIENALREFEDRIDKLQINITENTDNNDIEINVLFNMKTSTNTQSLTLNLNKIR